MKKLLTIDRIEDGTAVLLELDSGGGDAGCRYYHIAADELPPGADGKVSESDIFLVDFGEDGEPIYAEPIHGESIYGDPVNGKTVHGASQSNPAARRVSAMRDDDLAARRLDDASARLRRLYNRKKS